MLTLQAEGSAVGRGKGNLTAEPSACKANKTGCGGGSNGGGDGGVKSFSSKLGLKYKINIKSGENEKSEKTRE